MRKFSGCCILICVHNILHLNSVKRQTLKADFGSISLIDQCPNFKVVTKYIRSPDLRLARGDCGYGTSYVGEIPTQLLYLNLMRPYSSQSSQVVMERRSEKGNSSHFPIFRNSYSKHFWSKAELLLLKLFYLFSRELLLMKKLEIEKTKPNFTITVLKVEYKVALLSFFDFQLFH